MPQVAAMMSSRGGPPSPGSSTPGLPPSADLRSEPEVPVRPDLAERWGRRLGRFRDRHPRLARRTSRAHALWSWAALAVLVAAVIGVPTMRPALAVASGLLVLLGQLALLSRSRTVSFASCARTFVAGALLAVPIGLVEAVAASSLRMPVDDPLAVVYLAGPVEELLKLTPLLLLVGVARHRVRRFAAVDFCLVAAAAGAGFQFAEDAVRRVTAPPGALVGPLETAVSAQYAWVHLLPGSVDWGLVRFPGHAVMTGLVGLGIGLAVRTYRRYGRIVWLLPAGCFAVAVLDHMAWADAVYELVSGHVLTWPARAAYSLLGAGHGTRWLFLVLLAVAVVLDFRAVRLADAMLPPLPGTAPGGGLVARAERVAGRIRRAVPDDAAPVFHRLAGGLGAALVASADALIQAAHEAAIFLVAARQGPAVLFSALRLVRDRRELAQAIHHAAGRPRRDVPSRADVHRRAGRLRAALLDASPDPAHRTALAAAGAACAGVMSAGVAYAGVRSTGGGAGVAPAGPAFVATVADELVDWWYGIAPAAQVIAPLGALGLLAVAGGSWALPAGSLGAVRTTGFLRDPGGATKEFLVSRTPGQVLYYAAASALRRVVPEGMRRIIGEERPPDEKGAATRGPSSGLSFPPWQVQKQYAHCGPLFGLPAGYTHHNGERLRAAMREFVDAPGTVGVEVARYRGQPAVIHYDPRARVALVFRPGGEFWSGWRLAPAQYRDLEALGTL